VAKDVNSPPFVALVLLSVLNLLEHGVQVGDQFLGVGPFEGLGLLPLGHLPVDARARTLAHPVQLDKDPLLPGGQVGEFGVDVVEHRGVVVCSVRFLESGLATRVFRRSIPLGP
jgi:hypothetical protein